MSLFGRVAKRLRAATARASRDREMREEMQAHLEQAAARFRARGMSEGAALAAAQREFGNVAVIQEEARDIRGVQWIESIAGDLRHAARQFVRSPVLAGTIVLTLTLGIGISSAAFSVFSAVLTRPAPGVPEDDALVAIRGIGDRNGRLGARGLSYPELMEYARLKEFEAVAGWMRSSVVAELPGQSTGTAFVQYVTPNFFRTLGLQIAPGNGFVQTRVDERGSPELHAVIGHSFASEKFGSPAAAVGKAVRLNGTSVQIIGVAPPRFLGPYGGGDKETLWLPISAMPVVEKRGGEAFTLPTETPFSAIGRLQQGVSIEDVTPAVSLVASRRTSPPAARSGAVLRDRHLADVVRLRAGAEYKSEDDMLPIMVAMGIAVVLILLVCTTTVSSLLVGSAVTRRPEIAVRLALGASRSRIVRQLLTESALLAAAAGICGMLVYAAFARALRANVTDVDLDPTWGAALATTAFVLLSTVLCGLSPALHATRDALSGVLKDSSANSTVKTRLQRVFVVAQIALTQPLLVGLTMAIALVMGEAMHIGKSKVGDFVVRADFDNWSAAARAEKRMPALMERLSALPGVIAVIPQVNSYAIMKFEVPASPTTASRQFNIRTHEVPSGYFKTMDIAVMRGREFSPTDSALSIKPIVVGSDFAREAFGDVDPIGKRLSLLSYDGLHRRGEVQIVGVVAAKDVGTSQSGTQLRVFTPLGGTLGAHHDFDALLVRTERPAAAFIPTFRDIANTEAPMMPVREMKTLAQIERHAQSEILGAAGASAVGGFITLVLAAIGLYAVVALAVSQRRREIGVRVSLGAQPGQVVAHFFKSGLRVSVLGLIIGLPLSAAALKIVGSQVGIPKTNMPAIAAAVAITVVVVASLASWIPARRAAGVDPLIALRDS